MDSMATNEKLCESCGRALKEDAKFCTACGAPQKDTERKCQSCGSTLAANAKFCYACGAPQQGTPPAVPAAPEVVAPRSETPVLAEAEGVKLKASLVKDMLILRKKNGVVVGQIPLRRVTLSYHEAGRLTAGHITFAADAWGKSSAATFKVFFTAQQQPSFERFKGAIEREYARTRTSIPEPSSKLYPYRKAVNEGGELPTRNLTVMGATAPILKKGEAIHFADEATAKEATTVSLGYRGGSHGVSVPLPIKIGGSPIRYRVGSYAGHVQKEERIVDTSHGVLIITNKRLFLHPAPGHKPISIPLTKILSYQGFANGIEVYQEGRQKGYFFEIKDRDSVDVFEACLAYLTSG
jgi:hypothetical protein